MGLQYGHRLASTRHADRIVVLDGGRVAESGTPHELLDAGGLYAQLYAAQVAWYSEVSEVVIEARGDGLPSTPAPVPSATEPAG